MTKEELAKLQHEADVQNFNEWFLEVRWKVNLIAEYGYGTREALEVLKLAELESIVKALADLVDKFDALTVKNGKSCALAITGEVNTY